MRTQFRANIIIAAHNRTRAHKNLAMYARAFM